MKLRPAVALVLSLLVCTAAFAGPTGNGSCMLGAFPGATLLYPYFEADLNDPGHTMLFSVSNLGGTSHIVRVVLWTDYGVPTMAFDLYLKAFDIQTMNLQDILNGSLPQTGQGQSLGSFPHCAGTTVLPGGGILAASVARLKARHTGKPDPGTTVCAGFNHGDSIARGYLTIDVTDQCQPLSPSLGVGTPSLYSPGNSVYYASGDPNVLTGDFFFVNNAANQAEGNEAVHIVSDSSRFQNDGTFTFYGRYYVINGQQQGARDHRTPLASTWFSRYVNGGPFNGGTNLIIWREVPSTGVASCSGAPAWFPLSQERVNATDEAGNLKTIFSGGGFPFPLATQKVAVSQLGGAPLPGSFGGLQLYLSKSEAHKRQAYVLPVLSAEGRYSLGYNGTRIDDLCGLKP
ncbi:MAG: hypothetical protein ABI609_16955 [Acidobacteriota bacterium]